MLNRTLLRLVVPLMAVTLACNFGAGSPPGTPVTATGAPSAVNTVESTPPVPPTQPIVELS
ncbi:MAG TPA: hypothetical protein VJ020_01490, partial [Anaerolineales bacterium]|nr:hypothetical protein [Anaerolineales bacterium]